MKWAATSNGRYAAKVEKGENAWRREWSGFMSGVSMKDLRKGGGVALPKTSDLGAVGLGSESGCTFSYLFASAADRKAERLAKKREEEEKRRSRSLKAQHTDDPLAHLSKHERSVLEARKRGLNVEGMTRKEIRQFLNLTTSKEQRAAEEQQQEEEFKPHKLMDEKLQWYQQGPHPIDVVAEKLVQRKAAKKGRQLGLRYNYLLPHPSWMAKREQRRRESVMVGLGKRFTFDDDGNMLDLFGNRLDTTAMVVPGQTVGGEGAVQETSDGCTAREASASTSRCQGTAQSTVVHPLSMNAADILVDHRQACHSLVRAVVRNRNLALAIKNANLTTNYIDSALVKGPSIGLEDAEPKESEDRIGGGKATKRERLEVPPRRIHEAPKRSKAASFEP